MSSRFQYRPLALSLLALHSLPALAEEAAAPAPSEAPLPEAPAATAAPTATPAQELQTVTVAAEAEALYKAEKASSPKYTEPLRDTPKTITVVTKEAIEDQGLLSLREILSTVPGITFGAGEGGGGYGDSINIRGFSASGDIAIDGVRDSAQYTRSDPFNLESVEVTKGSGGAQNGAGAVGGSINLVSKTPKLTDATNVSVGVGTDNYYRLTADSNKKINDTTAVRVNVMGHMNDIPGRDVEQAERWGIAPSIAFGLGTRTRFSAAYFYQKDSATPQYGVPYYNGAPVPGIPNSAYLGYSNLDIQDSEVNALTTIFEQDIGSIATLRNLTRASVTSQYVLVDPPQGSYCGLNGLKPAGWTQTANAAGTVVTTNTSGYVPCAAASGSTPAEVPGTYRPSGPRGNVRDTRNTILTNQTDVTWDFNTGSIGHALVTGLAITRETYEFTGGNVLRYPNGILMAPPAAGSNPVLPDITHSDTLYYGPLNYVQTGQTSGDLNNIAVYAFETLKLTPKWDINLGARYDSNDGDSQTATYSTASVTSGVYKTSSGPVFEDKRGLFSYSTGIIFKPAENGSVYVSYSNSETPSKATVNGSCTAATCNVDPEEAITYEIGTKWDFAESRAGFTAALFRTDRSNYKVADPSNPDNPSGFQVLDGQSRVQGLELGISGQLTDKWAVYANGTLQESEVLQGVSNYVAAGGVNGTQRDFARGDELTQVPNIAGSLWTTYDFTPKLQLGYGLTYTGETYLTQHGGITVSGTGGTGQPPAKYVGSTTIPLVKSDDYVVHNLAGTYKFTRQLNVQVNVKNLLNAEYFTRIRNNGWATPGDERSAVATVNYSF